MQVNKKWICAVFLSLLLPVTAYAQTGLYKLPQGRMAVGFGFTGVDLSRSQDAIGIRGSLSYGISSRTRIALVANMGIIDEDRYYGSEFDVPPPVAIGVRPVHVGSLGQTGLDYFLTGVFYRGFSSGISRRLDDPTNERLLSVRTNGFTGGGGISKRSEINFGRVLNPLSRAVSILPSHLATNLSWVLNSFCGVSYSRSWTRVWTKGAREETEPNWIYSGFGATVGLEVELSPAISVIGAFRVSFEDFDGGVSLELNFH